MLVGQTKYLEGYFGHSVYHYVHIGNLRTFIFEDILRRTLESNNYTVKYIMNITDVGHLTSDGDTGEDKMLKGAKREKMTVWDVAEKYTQAFKEDIAKLNIKNPTKFTKATDHIKAQIAMIKKLEKNGFTYEAGGNVYFDTSKYKNYGKLVNLTKSEQARVEKDKNKKNATDFVLWFTKSKFIDQEMKWDCILDMILSDEEYEKLKKVAKTNKNVDILEVEDV